jgi:hypothetical protein
MLVFRLAALTALAGSAFELVRPLLSGGCAACALETGLVIRGWPVPLPWLGLGAALLLLLLSFGQGPRSARLRSGLSLVGGGVALWLLLVHAASGRPLCLTCTLVNGALLLAALVEATRATALSGPVAQAPLP